MVNKDEYIDIFKRYFKPIFSLAINYSTLQRIRDSVTVRYKSTIMPRLYLIM